MDGGTGPPNEPFAFLVGRKVDQETLNLARERAEAINIPTHTVLLANDWVIPEEYASRLAEALEVDYVAAHQAAGWLSNPDHHLIDATAAPPGQIASQVREITSQHKTAGLTSNRHPALTVPPHELDHLLDQAIHSLSRSSPDRSAHGRTWLWQKLLATACLGAALGMALVDTQLAYFVATFIAAVPFAMIVAQRLSVMIVALFDPLRGAQPIPIRTGSRRGVRPRNSVTADVDLPVYSVLVPLYREADILPDLVAALSKLNYPPEKLDVILILEAIDAETRRAADKTALPGYIRIVTVPHATPRTKPKALNYALHFARGEMVAIYDAEDVPDPDQLRAALAAFQSSTGPRPVCAQARLNVYNRNKNWFTRQFTLEYTSLFDGLLPALQWLRIPIPLGGTSNHFPRHVLEKAGGWDPFNVTEDADLGIRLARQGGRIVVLGSTTMEEAPDCLRTWLPQRTRWLKGWIQSYLVHMRRPVKLLRDLGPWRFLGFQLLIGGFLLSAFLHPLFYVFLAIELTRTKPFQAGHTHTELVFWHLALFNLAAGYLASILLAVLTTRRRGWRRLARHTLLMPVYWIFVSCAAYRALGQLLTAPHLWEKTRHHARTSALWRHHRPHRRTKSTPIQSSRRPTSTTVKRRPPPEPQAARPGPRH